MVFPSENEKKKLKNSHIAKNKGSEKRTRTEVNSNSNGFKIVLKN